MAQVFLITGGARSGKSEFAESICSASKQSVGYIATSQIYDEEMALRVESHQKRRPASWKVWECPDGDSDVLREAMKKSEIILFDCLTLFLTYWIFHPTAPHDLKAREVFIISKVEDLLREFDLWDGIVLVVTNEVGSSIVPENKIAREFRDLSGRANRFVAEQARETYFVSCGQAIPLKCLSVKAEEVLK